MSGPRAALIVLAMLAAPAFAQTQRQTDFYEYPLFECSRQFLAEILPEHSLCWDHAPRRLYEVDPGVWQEIGVDGYEVREDGEIVADLACFGNVFETPEGNVVLWLCPVSVSVLKTTRYRYVPGEAHSWCVRSYTHDAAGERHYSHWQCIWVRWLATCPEQVPGEGTDCLLTELP